MNVGDLVYLNKDQFYEPDEYIGVIVRFDREMVRVWWSNGKFMWLSEEELEVIDESGQKMSSTISQNQLYYKHNPNQGDYK